ncbi:MAG: flagellar protein FlgN [Dehalococcoidia bacterium]|nr:flagellar protein FlgN [Dehalococcoidia bacterium]
MTPEGQRERLYALADVLAGQSALLGELVRLSNEEQDALVQSDFDAIHRVSDRMLAVSQELEVLDRDREALVREFPAVRTLEDLVPLADDLGVHGFAPLRESLVARAAELRDVQEANARLILNAAKLRERWYGMLAGMSSPTYGSGGKQEFRQARDIVSRSA